MKLMEKKHVRASPCRDAVPTKSHSDSQNASYFPRTLRTVLLVLGCSEPPLFIGTSRLLRGNSYFWHVCVVIYERPTTIVSAKWSRLLHWGGRSRQAWERQPMKDWLSCDMKQMRKWHIRSTATSRAELKEAHKLWYCLLEVMTTWDASPIKLSWLMPWSEIWMKPSGRSSCWESMRRSRARRSQNWRLYARS
jgi:hypothetical protein